MDIIKLKELCDKYTLTVPLNGFQGFTHQVIDAAKLLEEIHTTSTLTKEEFANNINNGRYMRDEYENIFKAIKSQGVFRVFGYGGLSSEYYIERRSLKWLEPKA